jgi:transcriptional regulator with XRE-family HTH domain
MPYQYSSIAIQKQIGKRLRAERLKRDEKLASVAAGSKVSVPVISKIEQGTYPLSVATAVKLTNYYDVDYNYINRFEP